MPFAIRFTTTGTYLHAWISGVFSMHDAAAALEAVFAEYAAGTASGMLLDLRELQGVPATMDRYKVGMLYSAHAVKMAQARPGHKLRLAVVGHEPLIDPQRFGEDVAVNRGVNVRVFTDFDAAHAWLEAP
jgi:hypothetical protein